MSQIALPLAAAPGAGPRRIVVGSANAHVIEAMQAAPAWPFRTAILFGPPRSGKSLLARWFVEEQAGEAIDDAERMDETELFHRWNRAQEEVRPLLLVCNSEDEGEGENGGWRIELPDLASRLGAALHLSIHAPDDAMLAELIAVHAEMRGIALGPDASAYLVPRCRRSHLDVERLVAAIDRIALERKQPPTLAIWRDALDDIAGHGAGVRQPRLL